MRNKALRLLLAVGLMLLTLTQASWAYTVEGAELEVFRDGVVSVRFKASVNETEATVTLPLLSKDIYNVLALDEFNKPLDYDLNEMNITVYTLGATQVTLEYETDALTSKEAGIWTVSFNTSFPLLVRLPENSTIVYLNAPPDSIKTEGGTLVLQLPSGSWEISYELGSLPPQSPQPFVVPQEVVMAALAGVSLVAVASALLWIKRRKGLRMLRSEEAEVIGFLRKKGGKALEAELREAFPNIPKTSMWRLLKRLEKRGAIRIKKVGLQNVVELA